MDNENNGKNGNNERNEKSEVFEWLKSSLSAVGDMAKQGLDMAGKKGGEAVEITKLRWKLSQLRGETLHLYRELGKNVYLHHTKCANTPVKDEELLAELDKKHVEMESIKRDLLLRRGEQPCPNEDCPSTIHTGDVFCRKCGVPLNKETA